MQKDKSSTLLQQKLLMPIKLFIGQEKAGSIVLAVSVILALVLANSPWKEAYFHLFENHFGFSFNGETFLNFSIHHWINDGLMALFFFVVGLELKREFIGGELSDLRQTILPIGAAIGGMVMPAAIYIFLNHGTPEVAGWGIPMSTDIAFALGVVSLLGKRVPASAKLFLTTLAIVDDIGAVLVIAFFYTSHISLLNLGIGLAILAVMFIANKMGVKSATFYAVFGLGSVWVAFMLSGIHATIAAVLTALVIPADTTLNESMFLQRLRKLTKKFSEEAPNKVRTLEEKQVEILSRIKADAKTAIPPLQRLEHALGPFVTFVIMPVFALANAGIDFSEMSFDIVFSTSVVSGVALGLLLGKPLGVLLVSETLLRLKLAPPSPVMTVRRLVGLGFLASIGFTMSMFVSTLAFKTPEALIQAKLGIFVASLLGGILGYVLLSKAAKVPEEETEKALLEGTN